MPAKLRMKALVFITTWSAHIIWELINRARQWRILTPRVSPPATFLLRSVLENRRVIG